MYVNVEIGPYILQKRTNYSKFHLLDTYTKEDITKENKDILDKMVKDYTTQTLNPEKYFEIEDNNLVSLCPGNNIKYLFIPNGIININDNAFMWEQINFIHFPDTLKRIGSNAFFSTSLKTINIPDSVISIGPYAFEMCSELEKIYLPKDLKEIEKGLFYKCASLKEIEVPDAVTNINSLAFNFCTALESIKFPENLKKIEKSTFENCKLLKKIKLPKQLNTIEKSAFANCINLTEIEIPNEIDSIKENTFTGCENLKKIILSDNIKVLEYKIFKKCKKLKDITLPKSLKIINRPPFRESNVESLTFRHDLKSLYLNGTYDYDLISDSKINTLFIDNTVTKITPDAFKYSGRQIKKINYKGTKSEFEEFKNNNQELFNLFTNLEEINFVDDKEKDNIEISETER